MTRDISDYALIGDCETAALVGRDGSIDWLCWPRFDSGACFAALLGQPEHGRWRIAPLAEPVRVRRRYRGDSLILETEFETDTGAVRVIDFMPVRRGSPVSDLARVVVGIRGRVMMRMEMMLRFDYGRIVPWVTRLQGDGGVRAVAGPHAVILQSQVPVHGEGPSTVAEFPVEAGQRVPFMMGYSASHLPPPELGEADRALEDTEAFWSEWASRCNYRGPWREAVMRSLITVKALTYRPTGGIVAAPTTSLPESIGGPRNWDYRYCWIRDATFTLLSLINAGYRNEAEAWCEWLLRAVAGAPGQIQPLYGVAGEHRADEVEIDWLPGFRESRPVRIGNAAYGQLQIDVIGSVMDVLHTAREFGLKLDEAADGLQRELLAHLSTVWREPDHGLWEVRGGPRHFVHAKLMSWVAFDRAVRSAERYGLTGPVDSWRRLRDEIHADVIANGFHPGRNAFVQSYGSERLDAAVLQIPLMGFLPPDDPRVVSTTRAIERELMPDGLVLRYEPDPEVDGLPGGEGAFLACSFWLADTLLLQGREADAVALFERLLSLRNDVGLLAEEYDPRAGIQLGNFPQAFSHFALIDTAFNLTAAQGVVREAAESD